LIHIIAALVSGIVVDVLATLVFHFTDKNRALAATNTNVLLQGLVLFVFVDVSKDPVIAIPYLVGIWIGGIIGIKLKLMLEKKKRLTLLLKD
jgi:hypothetical protein